ncbi:MAG: glycosyltransferase family 4 protein [bacterium]
MQKFLLDITRLNTRKRASTPSGIDRVDLRYVEHFNREHTDYAVAWLGCLFLADKANVTRLTQSLRSRWGNKHEPRKLPLLLSLVDGNGLELVWVTLRNILPARWGLGQRYSRSFKRWIKQLDEPVLYINTSHVQLRSIPALRTLKAERYLYFMFFIHDLIPITHREYVRPGGAANHEKRLALLSELKAGVIANSHYTKRELFAWMERHELPFLAQSIEVISIGVEPEFLEPAVSPRPEERPYFLMLGTIEPRKNHLLVLNVWRRMVEEQWEDIPQLVIVGKRGWENENIIDMLERCEALEPYVQERQHLTDAELLAYLQHCDALIYPSFVEGWGMPVAEALTLETPVICSNIDVFQEVGQGQPTYIDPLNGIELLECLKGFSPRKPDYSPPTWEAHFEAVDRLLEYSPGG